MDDTTRRFLDMIEEIRKEARDSPMSPEEREITNLTYDFVEQTTHLFLDGKLKDQNGRAEPALSPQECSSLMRFGVDFTLDCFEGHKKPLMFQAPSGVRRHAMAFHAIFPFRGTIGKGLGFIGSDEASLLTAREYWRHCDDLKHSCPDCLFLGFDEALSAPLAGRCVVADVNLRGDRKGQAEIVAKLDVMRDVKLVMLAYG